MLTSIEWVSAVKSDTCIQSDYGIAKFLGISKASLSRYRQNITQLDEFIADKVADSLNIPAQFVYVSTHYERAKREEEKAVWMAIWQSIGGPQVEENIRKKLNDRVMQPAVKMVRISA